MSPTATLPVQSCSTRTSNRTRAVAGDTSVTPAPTPPAGLDEIRRTFTAMSCGVEITIVSHPAFAAVLADRAERRIRELERLWSRFLPESDISRLNRSGGEAVKVDPSTLAVIRLAVSAWIHTEGRFDPTLGNAMVELGYDRSFSALPKAAAEIGTAGAPDPHSYAPPSGNDGPPVSSRCGEIVIDDAGGTVRIPHGVALDLGGIGKGHAADVVVAELLERGATGVCVGIGGDVRCAGSPLRRPA